MEELELIENLEDKDTPEEKTGEEEKKEPEKEEPEPDKEKSEPENKDEELSKAVNEYFEKLKSGKAFSAILAKAKELKKDGTWSEALSNATGLVQNKTDYSKLSTKELSDMLTTVVEELKKKTFPDKKKTPDDEELAKKLSSEIESRDSTIKELSGKVGKLEELANKGVKKAKEELAKKDDKGRKYEHGKDGSVASWE